MRLLAAAEDQTDLTSRAQARHLDRHQLTVGNLAERAASWQHRDSHAHFDRALDAVETRQRHLNVDRRVTPLVGAQHALARWRRIVVSDHGLLPDLLDRGAAPAREWMLGMRQHHQFVASEHDRLQSAIHRLEGEDAKVERAVEKLGGNGARAHATHLDQRLRMGFREPIEVRQE